jgi:putative peptidoglycan lipid II flippase
LGNVIMALMIGLVPFSFVYMMQRAFFALEDTRTPFIFTSIQIAIHIAGSLTLGSLVEKEWLVVSISLLTAGSIVIQGVIAYALLKRRIGGLSGLGVGKALAGFVLAMIPAAALGYLTLQWIGGVGARSFALDSVLNSVAASALVSGVTLLSYLLLLWIFRVSELRELQAQLRSRLKRG